MSSLVQAEVAAEFEVMKQLSTNLETGKIHFNQLDETKMKDMSISKFEERLTKALVKIQKRNNKILENGSPDEIAGKYRKLKKSLLQNDRDLYWSNVFIDIEKDSDSSSLPEKEWLRRINSDEFRDKFKRELMDDIRNSGSVRAYYKSLKKKLNELKKQEVNFTIEHVLLVTFALMIIVGIFLIIFCPIGGAAFVIGLICVSTPMVFFMILMIRQLIDPITCYSNGYDKELFYAV
jgi:hypothetical protein